MSDQQRISVRALVEFLLRSGDLDNRSRAMSEDAMLMGSRIHRRLQEAAGEGYRPEVYLRCEYAFPDGTQLLIEGRADGIYRGAYPEGGPELTTIDEIKSTYRDVTRMKEPESVHLAQAYGYAWMYARLNDEAEMNIRMTYVSLDTEEIRYFYSHKTRQELERWFDDLMAEYRRWVDMEIAWRGTRDASIHALEFPYEYREGQRQLMEYVYRTVIHGRKLFLEAPTGSGKTLAVLYPSIKALGEGRGEKIFYLTARTVTATAPAHALDVLRESGLRLKSVFLTARDKICILEKANCNPESCPRAKGHFDRVNDAMMALLTHADRMDREEILAAAETYNVCPFELALDVSLYADLIIGDYNYAFDPHVYLRRFFAEGARRDHIFLVDEAHNLVDRGRSMYSAELYRSDVNALMKLVKDSRKDLGRKLKTLSAQLLSLGKAAGTPAEDAPASDGKPLPAIHDTEEISGAVDAVYAASASAYRVLESFNKRTRTRRKPLSEEEKVQQEAILDLYYKLSHFILIYEQMDESYCVYTRKEGRQTVLRLYCMDPGRCLDACMSRGRASILFSATLLPIQYYKKLLGGGEKDYEVYATSAFDPAKRALFIARNITSKYSRRGPEEYGKIADFILGLIRARYGNYLIFLPSHAFLREVEAVLRERIESGDAKLPPIDLMVQSPQMDEAERAKYLEAFETPREDSVLLGLGVLGGIFAEGIDLSGERLIGAVIVGTGIPQVGEERELLRRYFDETEGCGYDYAYRFPGMNKVMQAAGRVIRTAEDTGIVALLDERFLSPGYRALFPREWTGFVPLMTEEVEGAAERFWNEWL